MYVVTFIERIQFYQILVLHFKKIFAINLINFDLFVLNISINYIIYLLPNRFQIKLHYQNKRENIVCVLKNIYITLKLKGLQKLFLCWTNTTNSLNYFQNKLLLHIKNTPFKTKGY